MQSTARPDHQQDKSKNRRSRFIEAENCSVIQVKEEQGAKEVYLLQTIRLYNVSTDTIDLNWHTRTAVFYIYNGTEKSLNQAFESDGQGSRRSCPTISVGICTAAEILTAFEEVDDENERRINSL